MKRKPSKSSYAVALQENRFVDFLAWAIAHVNNPTLRHPFCPFCCSDKLAVGEMMLGDSFEDKNLSQIAFVLSHGIIPICDCFAACVVVRKRMN